MKSIREILGRQTIHPFPARMAPDIALEALGASKYKKPLKVLDPMVGSGTVLAVARANGHRAIGIDCDPLSVLLAKTWTSPINLKNTDLQALLVLERAKALFTRTKYSEAYPTSDKKTQKFLRFWFDDYSRKQLYCLAKCIGRTRDKRIRNALWAGFSRLIIAKSNGASRAMDLSHSRPHRVFDTAPLKPFNGFAATVRRVAGNCPQSNRKGNGPATDLRLGDARHLPCHSQTIDLVLTSPPYLNVIDYMRCSKFSLVWMGYTVEKLRNIRSESIGTEKTHRPENECKHVRFAMEGMCDLNNISKRNALMLHKYVSDMKLAIEEVARVLKPNARAVYVIGNSNLQGEFIENSTAARLLAESTSLKLQSEKTRELPPNRRYLPPPSLAKSGQSFQARMRTEVVLSFTNAG